MLFCPANPSADRDAISTLLLECGVECGDLGCFWIARSGRAIVAAMAVEVFGTSAVVHSLAVQRAFRGLGLGKILTGRIFDYSAGEGVRDVFLYAPTASYYFRALGFAPCQWIEVPGAALEYLARRAGAIPVSEIEVLHRNLVPALRAAV